MTIRMLQAWNGLPQQTVTTLTIAEEARLVGLGLASYDLDGPADNLRMAQLVTDAAGNPIGLSGGTPAAGVPFGPPSTIFRLRMRCSGGAANVTVTATKRAGGSDAFNFSLASGSDVSEPMYADDYSSMVWTKTGSGSVIVEVI